MAHKDKDLTIKDKKAILNEARMMHPEEFMTDPADPVSEKRVKSAKAKKIYENLKSKILGKIKNTPKWHP